jgi:hypothetical protein
MGDLAVEKISSGEIVSDISWMRRFTPKEG